MPDPGPRQGRPHDAEGAREAILNAAEMVFAEHGFDGARIDAIAAAAGYNKSLIFQYYGDKLGLYSDVIRRADDDTRVLQLRTLELLSVEGDDLKPDHFKEILRGFMREVFEYFQKKPRIMRIFQWEMAEGWQTYLRVLPEAGMEDLEQYGPIIYELQKNGLLRPDVDPLVQFINAEFLIMQYLSCIPVYQVFLADQDLSSAEMLAAGREFIIDMIVRGLVPDAPGPKSKGD
jgi:TetR/AcrR family transcriptional regulator